LSQRIPHSGWCPGLNKLFGLKLTSIMRSPTKKLISKTFKFFKNWNY